MDKTQKLIGYFKEYPFFQNIHFCTAVEISQSAMKEWIKGNAEPRPETVDRILPLIENWHFNFIGWKNQIGEKNNEKKD